MDLKSRDDESLSTYFQSVLSYFSKTESPPKELLTVKFEEFILSILSDRKNKMLADYFNEVGSSTKISIRVVMESNFTYNMKLEVFARLSGRSLSTFYRDFKKIYNTSSQKWLTQKPGADQYSVTTTIKFIIPCLNI